jgi:large subunit ribosomal protein L30
MPELLAVIRIRSLIDRNPKVRFTASLLKLTRVNICTLYPKTPSILGMLKTVSEVTTYGEINKDVLIELLKKRGRIRGNKKITEKILKKYNFGSFEEVAEHILKTGKIPNFIKPVFRLSPPKKGFKKSTKKFFSQEGELGYRGEKINELILRMI